MTFQLSSRLGLGTVQFGQDYGIANKRGKISPTEASAIMQLAASKGIGLLDTAHAYGDSEEVIGNILGKNPASFFIVTKTSSSDIVQSFEQSLTKLNCSQVYGYLLHGLGNVLENEKIWAEMRALKKQGRVKKIGFSLYSPEELDQLNEHSIEFDLLQLPYSIFDRRFEKYFYTLKQKNVEIHARSVFLQGLAFMNVDQLPVHFKDAEGQLRAIKEISAVKEIPITALCLNFVLLNKAVDRVIVGVDGKDHFQENLKSLDYFDQVSAIQGQLQQLQIDNEELLLPYKWPR